MINNTNIYKFFKGFTNYRKKTNWALVLAADLSPVFVNAGTTNETFKQSEKQDYFRHILKISASRCESSGSQFFKTATGIQSKPSWKLQKYYADLN